MSLCRRPVAVAVLVAAAATVTTTTAYGAPPAVNAPSAAVIETTTGTVIYAKNADQVRGMASTTKLMTALVALDRRPLDSLLTATNYRPSAAETRLGLHAGERMTLADLVRAMMLPSANDAAQTVAVRTAGSVPRFVALMNARARQEGLRHTHFANPVGLDAPTHRTTAVELAQIGVLAHDNPFLRATVKRRTITLTSGDVPRTIVNRNRTLGTRLPGAGVVDGMKTGHTNKAGYALVGSATRGGVTVVSAVLGDPSEAARDADTVRLLRWASTLFQRKTLVRKGTKFGVVPVEHGKASSATLVIGQTLQRVVPRGAAVTLKATGVPTSVDAPVSAGTTAGGVQVIVGGKLVATVPLRLGQSVERQSFPAAVAEAIGTHLGGALVALILILGGTLALVRARSAGERVRRPSPAVVASPPDPADRTTAP
jgi:D-alanyl-D-alanine carboxypeptidase (penicillin-binding protein 5/6)